MKRRAFLGGSTAAVAVVTVAPVVKLPVAALPPAKAYLEAVTEMGFGLAPTKSEGGVIAYDGEHDG